jgi:hypothetical protein
MRQILVLEESEVQQLQHGKTLLLSTGAGEIGLQFASNGHSNGHGRRLLKCDICGATHSQVKKQPFTAFGLMRHKAKLHGKK